VREGGADAPPASGNGAAASPVSLSPDPGGSAGSSGGGPSAQPVASPPPAPDPAAPPGARLGRQNDRARKRREADLRRRRNQVVGPMKKRVADLESRITELDAAQKQRTAQLADPAVYDDARQRAVLLNEYQSATAKLEELTARWEFALTELEQAEAELTATLDDS